MSENKQPLTDQQNSAGDSKEQVNIGQKLRAAREQKGYTLDDLQQITKIQKRYLIAIEDQNFKALPGDFYVRAFVKQYADTVGLDGNELLKDYEDELPETKTSEYSEHITQAVETRSSHHRTAEKMENARRNYLPTMIIAIIVIIILVIIWIVAIARNHDNSAQIDRSRVSVSGESSHKAKKKSSSSSKKTQKSTAIKLTESSRTANSVVYNAKSLKKGTTLQISTAARAWNSVTVDGTQRLGKTMNVNEKDNVVIAKNASSIVIRLGNASQTTLRIGGKKINVTANGRYPATRTVTINFGNNRQSSASSSSTTTTSGNQSTNTSTRTSNNGGNTGSTNRQNTTTNNTGNNQQTTTNRQTTTTNAPATNNNRQQGGQQ